MGSRRADKNTLLTWTERMHWKHSAQIVLYEMWGRGIGTARPVTVVDDAAGRIALYSHPGTPIVTRGTENRRSLGLSERIELMIRMLDPDMGEFREGTSPDSHVLALTPIDSWHSIMLFWSSEWQFKNWYVNLQSPLRRVRHGVQLHDYVLDLVVEPDLSWSWKDVDEFETLVARGFFSVEQESSIRSEADRVVKTVESGGPPFCDGWENWRPDRSWTVRRLPDDWFDTGGMKSGAC